MIDLDALRMRRDLSWNDAQANLALLNNYFWERCGRVDRLRFLTTYLEHRKADHPPVLGKVGAGLAQFCISVYGGYFGGGIGFLMLAALTAAGLTIRNANATKNVLAGVMNASAVAIFVFSPQLHWLQAGIACVGAALGGLVGGHMVSRVNQKLLRGFAVAIGVALTIGLFLRAP